MPDDLPRSSQQNRLFHRLCQDLADQVEWAGAKIDKEEWKRLVLAAHYGQRVVPNPFGGGFIVMNNKRSRDLARTGDDGMPDLIEQMLSFGNERGVKWSDEREGE